MKSQYPLIAAGVFLVLLGIMAVPEASAQNLDGRWYQLDLHLNTFLLDPVLLSITPVQFDITAYAHFVFVKLGVPPHQIDYQMDLWTMTSPGQWTNNPGSFDALSSPVIGNVFPDYMVTIGALGGFKVWTQITFWVRPVQGVFLGRGMITQGFDGLGNYVYGSIVVTGAKVTGPPFVPD